MNVSIVETRKICILVVTVLLKRVKFYMNNNVDFIIRRYNFNPWTAMGYRKA